MLSVAFPSALMIGCSTAGEIMGTAVFDDCLIATVVAFDKATVVGGCIGVADFKNSEAAGRALGEQLPKDGLRHVFVLADGLLTNGSEVVKGMTSVLSETVTLTGGLAGDGMNFCETFVVFNEEVKNGAIAAIGLYGDNLEVGFGSRGGWRPFGPERLITASEGNTLLELDGESALDLYKKYLGDEAANLPGSGLLFPLSIRAEGKDAVVRSILGVDEKRRSLYFAGEMPVGWYARLMRAAADDLIEGAIEAAKISRQAHGGKPELAILISCIGRKEVLQQLIEEETEGVAESLRSATPSVMTGFYSYGEIAPLGPGHKAMLHNQTMTITTISEG